MMEEDKYKFDDDDDDDNLSYAEVVAGNRVTRCKTPEPTARQHNEVGNGDRFRETFSTRQHIGGIRRDNPLFHSLPKSRWNQSPSQGHQESFATNTSLNVPISTHLNVSLPTLAVSHSRDPSPAIPGLLFRPSTPPISKKHSKKRHRAKSTQALNKSEDHLEVPQLEKQIMKRRNSRKRKAQARRLLSEGSNAETGSSLGINVTQEISYEERAPVEVVTDTKNLECKHLELPTTTDSKSLKRRGSRRRKSCNKRSKSAPDSDIAREKTIELVISTKETIQLKVTQKPETKETDEDITEKENFPIEEVLVEDEELLPTKKSNNEPNLEHPTDDIIEKQVGDDESMSFSTLPPFSSSTMTMVSDEEMPTKKVQTSTFATNISPETGAVQKRFTRVVELKSDVSETTPKYFETSSFETSDPFVTNRVFSLDELQSENQFSHVIKGNVKTTSTIMELKRSNRDFPNVATCIQTNQSVIRDKNVLAECVDSSSRSGQSHFQSKFTSQHQKFRMPSPIFEPMFPPFLHPQHLQISSPEETESFKSFTQIPIRRLDLEEKLKMTPHAEQMKIETVSSFQSNPQTEDQSFSSFVNIPIQIEKSDKDKSKQDTPETHVTIEEISDVDDPMLMPKEPLDFFCSKGAIKEHQSILLGQTIKKSTFKLEKQSFKTVPVNIETFAHQGPRWFKEESTFQFPSESRTAYEKEFSSYINIPVQQASPSEGKEVIIEQVEEHVKTEEIQESVQPTEIPIQIIRSEEIPIIKPPKSIPSTNWNILEKDYPLFLPKESLDYSCSQGQPWVNIPIQRLDHETETRGQAGPNISVQIVKHVQDEEGNDEKLPIFLEETLFEDLCSSDDTTDAAMTMPTCIAGIIDVEEEPFVHTQSDSPICVNDSSESDSNESCQKQQQVGSMESFEIIQLSDVDSKDSNQPETFITEIATKSDEETLQVSQTIEEVDPESNYNIKESHSKSIAIRIEQLSHTSDLGLQSKSGFFLTECDQSKAGSEEPKHTSSWDDSNNKSFDYEVIDMEVPSVGNVLDSVEVERNIGDFGSQVQPSNVGEAKKMENLLRIEDQVVPTVDPANEEEIYWRIKEKVKKKRRRNIEEANKDTKEKVKQMKGDADLTGSPMDIKDGQIVKLEADSKQTPVASLDTCDKKKGLETFGLEKMLAFDDVIELCGPLSRDECSNSTKFEDEVERMESSLSEFEESLQNSSEKELESQIEIMKEIQSKLEMLESNLLELETRIHNDELNIPTSDPLRILTDVNRAQTQLITLQTRIESHIAIVSQCLNDKRRRTREMSFFKELLSSIEVWVADKEEKIESWHSPSLTKEIKKEIERLQDDRLDLITKQRELEDISNQIDKIPLHEIRDNEIEQVKKWILTLINKLKVLKISLETNAIKVQEDLCDIIKSNQDDGASTDEVDFKSKINEVMIQKDSKDEHEYVLTQEDENIKIEGLENLEKEITILARDQEQLDHSKQTLSAYPDPRELQIIKITGEFTTTGQNKQHLLENTETCQIKIEKQADREEQPKGERTIKIEVLDTLFKEIDIDEYVIEDVGLNKGSSEFETSAQNEPSKERIIKLKVLDIPYVEDNQNYELKEKSEHETETNYLQSQKPADRIIKLEILDRPHKYDITKDGHQSMGNDDFENKNSQQIRDIEEQNVNDITDISPPLKESYNAQPAIESEKSSGSLKIENDPLDEDKESRKNLLDQSEIRNQTTSFETLDQETYQTTEIDKSNIGISKHVSIIKITTKHGEDMIKNDDDRKNKEKVLETSNQNNSSSLDHVIKDSQSLNQIGTKQTLKESEKDENISPKNLFDKCLDFESKQMAFSDLRRPVVNAKNDETPLNLHSNSHENIEVSNNNSEQAITKLEMEITQLIEEQQNLMLILPKELQESLDPELNSEVQKSVFDACKALASNKEIEKPLILGANSNLHDLNLDNETEMQDITKLEQTEDVTNSYEKKEKELYQMVEKMPEIEAKIIYESIQKILSESKKNNDAALNQETQNTNQTIKQEKTMESKSQQYSIIQPEEEVQKKIDEEKICEITRLKEYQETILPNLPQDLVESLPIHIREFVSHSFQTSLLTVTQQTEKTEIKTELKEMDESEKKNDQDKVKMNNITSSEKSKKQDSVLYHSDDTIIPKDKEKPNKLETQTNDPIILEELELLQNEQKNLVPSIPQTLSRNLPEELRQIVNESYQTCVLSMTKQSSEKIQIENSEEKCLITEQQEIEKELSKISVQPHSATDNNTNEQEIQKMRFETDRKISEPHSLGIRSMESESFMSPIMPMTIKDLSPAAPEMKSLDDEKETATEREETNVDDHSITAEREAEDTTAEEQKLQTTESQDPTESKEIVRAISPKEPSDLQKSKEKTKKTSAGLAGFISESFISGVVPVILGEKLPDQATPTEKDKPQQTQTAEDTSKFEDESVPLEQKDAESSLPKPKAETASLGIRSMVTESFMSAIVPMTVKDAEIEETTIEDQELPTPLKALGTTKDKLSREPQPLQKESDKTTGTLETDKMDSHQDAEPAQQGASISSAMKHLSTESVTFGVLPIAITRRKSETEGKVQDDLLPAAPEMKSLDDEKETATEREETNVDDHSITAEREAEDTTAEEQELQTTESQDPTESKEIVRAISPKEPSDLQKSKEKTKKTSAGLAGLIAESFISGVVPVILGEKQPDQATPTEKDKPQQTQTAEDTSKFEVESVPLEQKDAESSLPKPKAETASLGIRSMVTESFMSAIVPMTVKDAEIEETTEAEESKTIEDQELPTPPEALGTTKDKLSREPQFLSNEKDQFNIDFIQSEYRMLSISSLFEVSHKLVEQVLKSAIEEIIKDDLLLSKGNHSPQTSMSEALNSQEVIGFSFEKCRQNFEQDLPDPTSYFQRDESSLEETDIPNQKELCMDNLSTSINGFLTELINLSSEKSITKTEIDRKLNEIVNIIESDIEIQKEQQQLLASKINLEEITSDLDDVIKKKHESHSKNHWALTENLKEANEKSQNSLDVFKNIRKMSGALLSDRFPIDISDKPQIFEALNLINANEQIVTNQAVSLQFGDSINPDQIKHVTQLCSTVNQDSQQKMLNKENYPIKSLISIETLLLDVHKKISKSNFPDESNTISRLIDDINKTKYFNLKKKVVAAQNLVSKEILQKEVDHLKQRVEAMRADTYTQVPLCKADEIKQIWYKDEASLFKLITLQTRLEELIMVVETHQDFNQVFEDIIFTKSQLAENLAHMESYMHKWERYKKEIKKIIDIIENHSVNDPLSKIEIEYHDSILKNGIMLFEQALSKIELEDEAIQRDHLQGITRQWDLLSQNQFQELEIDSMDEIEQNVNNLESVKLSKVNQFSQEDIPRMKIHLSQLKTLSLVVKSKEVKKDDIERLGWISRRIRNLMRHLRQELENLQNADDAQAEFDENLKLVEMEIDRITCELDIFDEISHSERQILFKIITHRIRILLRILEELKNSLRTLPSDLKPDHSTNEEKVSQQEKRVILLQEKAEKLKDEKVTPMELRIDEIQKNFFEANSTLEILEIKSMNVMQATELENVVSQLQDLLQTLKNLRKEMNEALETEKDEVDQESLKATSKEVSRRIEEALELFQRLNSTKIELERFCETEANLWRSIDDVDNNVSTLQRYHEDGAWNSDTETIKKLQNETNDHEEAINSLHDLSKNLNEKLDSSVYSRAHFRTRINALEYKLSFVKRRFDELAFDAETLKRVRDSIKSELEEISNKINEVNKQFQQCETDVKNIDQKSSDDLINLQKHLINQLDRLSQGKSRLSNVQKYFVLNSTDSDRVVLGLSADEELKSEISSVKAELSSSLSRGLNLYASLTDTFATRNDFDAWDEFVENASNETAPSSDLGEQLYVLRIRKTVLRIQQILILRQCVREVLRGNSKMGERLEMLNRRHRDVISRLKVDDDVIERKLDLWRSFQEDQQRIKIWVKVIEDEKSLLNLKNLRLDAIPLAFQRIQELLDRMPEGESMLAKLSVLYGNSELVNIDETIGLCLLRELNAVTEQVSNLRAGLLTWLDHLERIRNLQFRLESTLNDVQTTLTETEQFIEIETEKCKDSRQLLEDCTDQIDRLKSKVPTLNSLEELHEELSLTLSPDDGQLTNLSIWKLRQDLCNLETRLALQIQEIEEREAMLTLYNKRFQQFLQWANEFEARIRNSQHGANPNLIASLWPRIESELEHEIGVKDREVEWLTKIGSDIHPRLTKDQQPELEESNLKLQDRWKEIQELYQERLSKWRAMRKNSEQLEIDILLLRQWMQELEKKVEMASSDALTSTSEEEYQNVISKYQEIDDLVQERSPKVIEVLSQSESLFSDSPDLLRDTGSTRTHLGSLKRRWDGICGQIVERRQQTIDTWNEWQKLIRDHQILQTWLNEKLSQLSEMDVESSKMTYASLEEIENKLKTLENELTSRIPALDDFNDQYCRLAREGRLDSDDSLKLKFIGINGDWDEMSDEIVSLLKRVKHSQQLYNAFCANRDKEMIWMRTIDARLTEVEFSTSMDPAEKKSNLSQIKKEFNQRKLTLDQILDSSLHLVQRSSTEDGELIENLAQEFTDLRSDVTARLANLDRDLSSFPDVESKSDEDQSPLPQISVHSSIQVDNLTFERDVGFQVNTLNLVTASQPDSGISESVSPMNLTDPGLQQTAIVNKPARLRSSSSGSSDGANTSKQAAPTGARKRRSKRAKKSESRILPTLISDSKSILQQELDAELRELNSKVSGLDRLVQNEEHKLDEMNHLLASCHLSLDLVSHQQTSLRSVYQATDEEVRESSVQEVRQRLQLIATQIAKKKNENQEIGTRFDTSDEPSGSSQVTREASASPTRSRCPMCKKQNWKQLDQEMWRMERWLEYASGTLRAYQGTSPPTTIENLEDAIQDHREFLMELDSHKSVMMSVNVLGGHLAEHSCNEEKSLETTRRLESINDEWDVTCERATQWQTILQTALMQNPEFHRTVDELTSWLESTTASIRSSEPVDLRVAPAILEEKLKKFRDLHTDLQRCEPRIVSLQEAADQLELQYDGDEDDEVLRCRDVQDKLSLLSQRLRALMNVCSVYSNRLARSLGLSGRESLQEEDEDLLAEDDEQQVLPTLSDELLALGLMPISTTPPESAPSDQTDAEESVLSRSYRFLGRVVRAAVPIQAMMLILLGVSSIVPLEKDELICTVQNNLGRSFEPMLRWSNGPPPL